MTSFIHNKNSLIWAFNEAIDKDTKFDGSTNYTSINQNIDIINLLLFEKSYDSNITEELLTKYLSILTSDYLYINIYASIYASIGNNQDNVYLFNGWREHAILLFWEKQTNDLYNFGMINCGQGADIQGANNILCNGLIIFKDIEKDNINNFLKTYQKYEKTTNGWDKFKTNKIYFSFYFILFDKLLSSKS